MSFRTTRGWENLLTLSWQSFQGTHVERDRSWSRIEHPRLEWRWGLILFWLLSIFHVARRINTFIEVSEYKRVAFCLRAVIGNPSFRVSTKIALRRTFNVPRQQPSENLQFTRQFSIFFRSVCSRRHFPIRSKLGVIVGKVDWWLTLSGERWFQLLEVCQLRCTLDFDRNAPIRYWGQNLAMIMKFKNSYRRIKN